MDVIAIDQQGGKGNCSFGVNVMPTLLSDSHGTPHGVCYEMSRSMLKGCMNAGGMPVGEEVQPAITANGCGAVCYAIENHPNDSRVTVDTNGIVQTLSSRMGTGGNNTPFVLIENGTVDMEQRKHVLRRLTPLECARLQGFPDWWVDGVEGSDSTIYKMWGNGIALPCAADVIGRLAKELEATTP